MSRQRYDQVPQHDADSPIVLSPINHPAYTPYPPASILSSRASISSQHQTQFTPPSIPDSPPPSFHTHSSPGTPRPTPSTTAPSIAPPQSHRSFAAELWGVAPSTVTGDDTEAGGTSNDALATIAGLKQRVEWLEESIGRLLLERENEQKSGSTSDTDRPSRDNCCVSFTDASPDLESALTSGHGSNCCVSYNGRNLNPKAAARKQCMVSILLILFVMLVFFVICGSIVLVAATGGGGRGPPKGSFTASTVGGGEIRGGSR